MAKLKRTDYYLRTRTSPPIYGDFRRLMLRVDERKLAPLPHKRKGTDELVLSAIVADFLARPEAEQDAAIRRWAPEIERQIREHFGGDEAESEQSPPDPQTPPPARRRARGAG